MEDGALALCVFRAGPVACRSTHYDVFLSFPGGSDTARDSLPGRLHAGLAAAGVSLCEPDKSQAVGSSSLLPDAAVRQSKICIPILSQDYPSSERCLRGLVQMMEGKRSARQMVLPIFDRVEPSHVRYLTSSFEKVRHSDIEGVQRALFEVSMLHGWKVTDGKWCLHELRKMMECSDSMGHVALPLFYGVSPADAKYQRGSFKDAFCLRAMRDDSQEDIMEDQQALRRNCETKGYDCGITRPSMYGELITQVVRSTLELLRHHFQLDVPEHLLSIDDRGKSDDITTC